MAEGKTVNIEREMCPLDLYSSCQDGDKYTRNSTCRSDLENVCSFFLKGNCKFGDTCWFRHSTDINSISESWNGDRMVQSSSLKVSHDVNNVGAVRATSNLKNYNSMPKVAPISCGPNSPNWVNAPEFVPKSNRSYSDALKSNNGVIKSEPQTLDMQLCNHFYEGLCSNYECPYIHGDLCELCHTWCLDPFNEMQRNCHIEQCEKELVQNMEYSFAFQRSLDKTCGICMDVIMDKYPLSERFFGILENCNHVFCLSCIRKWRSVEKFEIAEEVERLVDPIVTRSCPECRVSSNFITPSVYFVDSEIEKKKIISEYKLALSKRPCKYFRQGAGTCPFGGACFYLHAKPDGTKVILPLPSKKRRLNQDGELDYESDFSLWDFLEVREMISEAN